MEAQTVKTVLQELIEWIRDERKKRIPTTYQVENKAIELLPKERHDIINAFNQGYREGELLEDSIKSDGDISDFSDAEDYFNQTFNH